MEKKPLSHVSDQQRRTALQHRLERHFITCSAAVGAAAAFAPAQEAQATIQYFDPADIQITLNTNAGIYFNLETGAFGTSAAAVPGWDINIFNPSVGNLFTYGPASTGIAGYTAGAYSYANRLVMGSSIGPASTFVGAGGITTMSYANTFGQWTGNTTGFIGIQFTLANNNVVYGWIRVEVLGGGDARVLDWAFEDSGGAIMAGAIPEPSSVALSLLAAGALGLLYWRKHKTAAA